MTRRRDDQLFVRLPAPIDLRWFAGAADVAYSPDFTIPPTGGGSTIVTLHDLAFMTHPELAPAGLRAYLNAVVSEATKRDLIDHLKVDPRRIALTLAMAWRPGSSRRRP